MNTTQNDVGGVTKGKDGRKVSAARKEPKSDIGKRVDGLAMAHGLSRTDLAKACGVIPVSFNRTLVQGHLAARIMPALADALDVTIHYLITGKDDSRAERSAASRMVEGLLEVGRSQG